MRVGETAAPTKIQFSGVGRLRAYIILTHIGRSIQAVIRYVDAYSVPSRKDTKWGHANGPRGAIRCYVSQPAFKCGADH